jgi:predicted dehydrogenase
MKPLRIAVAGAGYIGLAHIQAIAQNPRTTLAAVVDPSPLALRHAQAAGVALYPSLEHLLAQKRPDAIILATPNALHLAHALWCVQAGLPFLLEKPITPTVAEAEQLVAAIEQTKARALIGHHRAHSPIMAQACTTVASGQLGRLVSVTGSATFYKPDEYFDAAPWRRQAGGGPILINLIHEVHNLRMLCGEISAVHAFASNAVRGFEVEDTVTINLRFANGVLGNFMLSDTAASARSWEQTSGENPAYPSHSDEDCYVISGTHGSLSVPTMRIKHYPRVSERSWWKPLLVDQLAQQRGDPLAHQLEHFVQVIQGLAEPLVSARDALLNLRVTQAITESAHSGQVIHLNHPTGALV